jgi:hypothetical protein
MMKLSVNYEIDIDDSEFVTGVNADDDDDGIQELLDGARSFLKHAVYTARNVTSEGSDKFRKVTLVSMKQINPNPNSLWANTDWAKIGRK